MTIQDEIKAMNLSCNVERALLLLADSQCENCSEKVALLDEMSNAVWDIARSTDEYRKEDANRYAVDWNGTPNQDSGYLEIDVNPILINVNIQTVRNSYLKLEPKLILERYKPFRAKGRLINPNTNEWRYEKYRAGFVREQLNNSNFYYRVNEFDLADDSTRNTIDIRPQAYFKHSNDTLCKSLGVPADYNNKKSSKQIFRFVLQVLIDGKRREFNSPPFMIRAEYDPDNTRGFIYYGLEYRT